MSEQNQNIDEARITALIDEKMAPLIERIAELERNLATLHESTGRELQALASEIDNLPSQFMSR